MHLITFKSSMLALAMLPLLSTAAVLPQLAEPVTIVESDSNNATNPSPEAWPGVSVLGDAAFDFNPNLVVPMFTGANGEAPPADAVSARDLHESVEEEGDWDFGDHEADDEDHFIEEENDIDGTSAASPLLAKRFGVGRTPNNHQQWCNKGRQEPIKNQAVRVRRADCRGLKYAMSFPRFAMWWGLDAGEPFKRMVWFDDCAIEARYLGTKDRGWVGNVDVVSVLDTIAGGPMNDGGLAGARGILNCKHSVAGVKRGGKIQYRVRKVVRDGQFRPYP